MKNCPINMKIPSAHLHNSDYFKKNPCTGFLEHARTICLSPSMKKACKLKKNCPIKMKIPGAHLHMVSNVYTNFQKIPCIGFLEHARTKCLSPYMEKKPVNRKKIV